MQPVCLWKRESNQTYSGAGNLGKVLRMNFKINETAQKLRGGYYTPSDLACFLAKWVCHDSPTQILEPSCGDGVFFDAIAACSASAEIYGFELNKAECHKASIRAQNAGLRSITLKETDFLGWAIREIKNQTIQFDAVLGNPPFIRYQYLPPEFQSRAEMIFDELHCKFTKHTNAWVPFILASFALLRPGGRLGMVVPAEIIHVMHAQSLRSYLGKNAKRLVIIDPEEIWFEDTLQGAVLLLAEKKEKSTSRSEGLGIVSVKGRDFLRKDPEEVFRTPQAINGKTVSGKWTRAFLDTNTRSLLDDVETLESVHIFKDIADVDVGIVTGANKYFLVHDDVVHKHGLKKWAHPMFGRSEHCPGVIYDELQHQTNARQGSPTNFLWFKDASVITDRKVKEYILLGEKQELHKRFKCRVRTPWYSVPSVYSTEIGMLKRAHDTPRLILNRIGAYTTDTAYRITVKRGTADRLAYCFLNALTALSAELEGRHYGGGVLELVPSEIERLLVPVPARIRAEVKELDRAVRSLPMDAVLEQQTANVLGPLGLSAGDRQRLLSAWQRLRDRRHRNPSESSTASQPTEEAA